MRRSAFPSWTWQEWKGSGITISSCQGYLNHPTDVIRNENWLVHIGVEFEASLDEQQVLEWEKNFLTISTKVDTGQRPLTSTSQLSFFLSSATEPTSLANGESASQDGMIS